IRVHWPGPLKPRHGSPSKQRRPCGPARTDAQMEAVASWSPALRGLCWGSDRVSPLGMRLSWPTIGDEEKEAIATFLHRQGRGSGRGFVRLSVTPSRRCRPEEKPAAV